MQSRYVRAVSVLLHWTACGILGCVNRQLFLSAPTSSSDNSSMSFAGSLSVALFAIHPLHVEVLMWPSAQPYPLAMLFTSIMLYLHVSHKPWSAIGAVAYTCAGLSKSIALFTPVGLVLLDVVHDKIQPGHTISQHLQYLREIALFILLSVGLAVTTYCANQGGAGVDVDTISLTLSQRVAKLFVVIVWPLQAWIWPVGLRPHYQIRDPDDLSFGSNPSVVLSAVLVGMTFVVGMHSGMASSSMSPANWIVLAAAVYIVAMVLPVSGLIQHGMVSLTADRYAYFAMIVIIPVQTVLFHRMGRRWAPFVALALLGVWGATTAMQAHAWRTEEGLWRYCLREAPSDWRTLDQLAEFYLEYGRNAEAMPLIERSIWFGPTRGFKAQLFQAKQRMFLNRVDQGCAMYAALLDERPHHPVVLNNMAVCALYRGNVSGATSLLQAAVAFEERGVGGVDVKDSIPAPNLSQLPAFSAGERGFKAQLMW